MIITTNEELKDFCAHLKKEKVIALDTEFIRETTYWPILCLIQIAGKTAAACIDPLAKDLDLTPLYALLKSKKIIKVFHSAHQDIEIFYHLTGFIPAPLFDTQVGAMVLGLGECVSYANLIQALTGQKVDKAMRSTDWSRRPLTTAQEKYALGDVTYLSPAYEKMITLLKQKGRSTWVKREMMDLLNPDLYETPSNLAYKKIHIVSHNPRFIALLQRLCAWREERAKRLNRPRGFILKDDALLEIAASQPRTKESFLALRKVPKSWAKSDELDNLVEMVNQIANLPDKDLPPSDDDLSLSAKQHSIKDMLRFLLQIVCQKEGVAPKVVASMEDLIALTLEKKPKILCMKGWRYELFGKLALEFKQGKKALIFNPQTTQMEFITIPLPSVQKETTLK